MLRQQLSLVGRSALGLLILGGILLLGRSAAARPAVAQQVTGVCAAPTVTVSAAPRSASIGQSVRFQFTAVAGAGCTMGTAPLPSMLISFGDGTSPLPLNGPSGSINHTYSAPGVYTVRVTASSAGLIGQATTTVVVAPSGGQTVVTLSATPQSAVTGQTVDFLGQVISAAPGSVTVASFLDFGDGNRTTPQTTGAGFIAQHTYTAAGTYTATLIVIDSTGGTAQGAVMITVTPSTGQPVVRLTASPRSVLTGQAVDFTGQVIWAAPGTTTASVTINFGDGRSVVPQTTGAGFIAQHGYLFPGTYRATLTVTDTSGAVGRATTTITVSSPQVKWP